LPQQCKRSRDTGPLLIVQTLEFDPHFIEAASAGCILRSQQACNQFPDH
jgi:hypothetical protein